MVDIICNLSDRVLYSTKNHLTCSERPLKTLNYHIYDKNSQNRFVV